MQTILNKLGSFLRDYNLILNKYLNYDKNTDQLPLHQFFFIQLIFFNKCVTLIGMKLLNIDSMCLLLKHHGLLIAIIVASFFRLAMVHLFRIKLV